MQRKTDLQSLIFKLRGGIWTALFLGVFFYADPSMQTIPLALILVTAGQILRFWAAGNIGLYRGEKVKARQLVTWGPYALIRNPLYLANGMIGAGWSFLAGKAVFLVFLMVFVAMYNLCIIPLEESFLEQTFGDRYRAYRERTGRFIPKSLQLPSSGGPFNVGVILKSEIHSVLVTLAGTVLLLSRIWW